MKARNVFFCPNPPLNPHTHPFSFTWLFFSRQSLSHFGDCYILLSPHGALRVKDVSMSGKFKLSNIFVFFFSLVEKIPQSKLLKVEKL